MRLPVGEWTPDLPAIGINQLRVAKNVLARDGVSYAPFPSTSTSFNALPDRVTGAFAGRKPDGLIQLFCGTQAKLFQTLAGPAWTDVTNAGGDYVSLANPWKFAELKFRVVATNYEDPIQTWQLDVSSAFSDLSASAPRAKYVATWFPGFMPVAYTNDVTDGERPTRVWWPAFNDPTDWPTPGSADAEAKQSNFVDLTKGGLITGLTGPVGGASGAVFCQTAIYRVDYEGPPTVFRIVDVEVDRGTNAPQSIVSIGNTVFYLGNDGFYAFNGVQSVPIGSQKIDKTFYGAVDQGFIDRVYGVADPINKIVMWLFPVDGGSGMPSRVVAYNWEVGRWTEAELTADMIAQIYTPAYTIDTIDGFGHLDEILPSLDSRAWLGGSQSLVIFNDSHKLAFFGDDTLEATLETGDISPENGRKLRVMRARPFIDGNSVTMRVGYANEQSDDDSTVTYTDWEDQQRDGTHLFRTRSRYSRFGVKVAAGSDWRHMSGIDVETKDGGV